MKHKSALVVKRYKTDEEYQKDAQKMLSQGYEVQSVISERPEQSCAMKLLGIFTLGLFLLIFKKKPVLVVTYRLSV